MLRHGNGYIVPREVLFMLHGIKMRSNDGMMVMGITKRERKILSSEGHSLRN